MLRLRQTLTLLSLCAVTTWVRADESSYGISGNPGAVNIVTGTGDLSKWLHIPEKSGVRLGGLWIGDYNALVNGRDGAHHNRVWTGNSLFILDLSIDLQNAYMTYL